MNKKEAFRRWLQTQKIKKNGKPLGEKVVEGYIKALSKLSDEMYEDGVISKRLYSMSEASEVKEAVGIIQKNKLYETSNKACENMMGKALKCYSEFAEIYYK